MAWRFYSEDNDASLVAVSGHNKAPNSTGGNWLTKNNLRDRNNWVGGLGWSNSGSQWRVYRKDTDMVDSGPSKSFVLLNEREDSINDGYFVVDMAGWPNNSQLLVDYPASYHNNVAGFSFADGHSEIHKWLDKRTTPKINKGDMQLNVSMVKSVNLL